MMRTARDDYVAKHSLSYNEDTGKRRLDVPDDTLVEKQLKNENRLWIDSNANDAQRSYKRAEERWKILGVDKEKRWLGSSDGRQYMIFRKMLQSIKTFSIKSGDALQKKINTYAFKAIGQLNDFNPFLVNMVTGGPIVMPYPFGLVGFTPEGYLENIQKSYKTLGCPIEERNKQKIKESKRCITAPSVRRL